jgi:DNA invertase Pin-like site-specific DNA recombinase
LEVDNLEKVAIYCRLSDEDRNKIKAGDDSESIQNQKNLLTKYAIEKGWSIYKIYSDDDYSGLDKDRPEWNMMLKDAEEKKFNITLCKNQARFSRDMEAIEKYLHNKFNLWGIRFIGVVDNADTSNKGNKKARQITGLTNEWYCEEISENIISAFNIKRDRGQFIGSFATYGYLKNPDDKNKLIIDKEASKIVIMIFNLYLEGYGTQHIAHILNEKMIPNPTKYKQSMGFKFKNSSATDNFGLWNKTTVKRILKNEVYIGNMIQGKRKKVSYKEEQIVSTTQDKWFVVENTHEAVIDKKMFEDVQKRILSRQRSSGEGKAHIFATKIKCADCGSSMVKVTTSTKISYLRCKIYATASNSNICTSHIIRFDKIEEVVTNKVKEYINLYLDEENVASKLQIESENKNKINQIKNELNNIDRQLNNNTLALKNLYMDKVKSIITEEEFIELKNSFSEEKDSLLKKKEQIENVLKEVNNKNNDINEWIKIVKQYKDFKELNHMIVNQLIDFIEIGEKDKTTKEQKIKIHWKL